ncbi:sporulation histidine kinase inhibitor Sda [Bacillus sp. AK031]
MESIVDLSDDQVIEIYNRSIEERVVREFIEMVRQELNRRGLLSA